MMSAGNIDPSRSSNVNEPGDFFFSRAAVSWGALCTDIGQL